jgi:hypothetical protein
MDVMIRGWVESSRCLRACVVVALGFAAPMLAACAGSDVFGSSKPETTASTGSTRMSSGGRSFSDRISDFIPGMSSKEAAMAAADAAPGAPTAEEIDCPSVDVRQGASTLSIMDPKASSPALGQRYQGTITRTARECRVRDKMVNIRIGLQGRIIIGPAGGAGQVTVPIRFALVRDGIEPKTLYTKLHVIPVTVPEGQPNVLFSHVEEDMTVPMPPLAEFDNYVIYVGFDPQGAATEQSRKKPPPKPSRPALRPSAQNTR